MMILTSFNTQISNIYIQMKLFKIFFVIICFIFLRRIDEYEIFSNISKSRKMHGYTDSKEKMCFRGNLFSCIKLLFLDIFCKYN